MQIGGGRRTAQPAARGDLVEPHALLRCAVEVWVGRQPRRLRRGDVVVAERVHLVGDVRYRDRPAAAAPAVLAREVVLHRAEMGQQIVIAPAGIAQIAPAVVILGLTANEHHRIDRTRPAQNLATRPIADAAVRARVRFGPVAPVEPRMMEGPAIADRQPHPDAQIARPGLEQRHGRTAISAQPVGEHAARRPRADDHVIGILHHVLAHGRESPDRIPPSCESRAAIRRKRGGTFQGGATRAEPLAQAGRVPQKQRGGAGPEGVNNMRTNFSIRGGVPMIAP